MTCGGNPCNQFKTALIDRLFLCRIGFYAELVYICRGWITVCQTLKLKVMALITELTILNPADKTRMYSVCTGKGAPTDAADPLIADVLTYPIGSQYTDLTGKKFYVRMADAKAAADWVSPGA